MDRIVTIAERKARAESRKRASINAAMSDLKAYAAAQGGRFLVFGSAAKDTIRYHSDLDILVDFPPEAESAAWRRAEEICQAHGVEHDIHSLARSSAGFLDRVRPGAITLG